jgi:imidazolonepropionase-like amidohydrolase
VGGLVVPIVGDPIESGTVLISGGKITAVGAEVETPRGTTMIDAAGRWVLPGFVEAHGHVGVHEQGIGWAGQDTNELTDPVGARFRALDAINPADESFRDALAGGVTSVVVKPGSGNPIGGQTVAVKSWGRIVDEMVFAQPCSVKSALGENPKRVYGEKKQTPSTRLGVAAVIRDAFRQAEDYQNKRDQAAREGKPFDLRNPGLLARAGVKIAITSDHPVVKIKFLIYQVILSVKEGLDRDTALRSVTINPAEMLGLDHRIGSLEVGKDADVVLWGGDPLEIMSRARTVFVEGRRVYDFDEASGRGVTVDPYLALRSEWRAGR